MWKIAAFLFLFTASASAFWEPCANTQAIAPDSVSSPSCSGNSCTGVRGQSLIADVTFTPRSNHNDLRVEVWATVLGINIPLPGEPPHDNACNNIFINNVRTQCPVSAGVQLLWVIQMDIPLTLPSLNNARIRYQIFDGAEEVLCANILATLI